MRPKIPEYRHHRQNELRGNTGSPTPDEQKQRKPRLRPARPVTAFSLPWQGSGFFQFPGKTSPDLCARGFSGIHCATFSDRALASRPLSHNCRNLHKYLLVVLFSTLQYPHPSRSHWSQCFVFFLRDTQLPLPRVDPWRRTCRACDGAQVSKLQRVIFILSPAVTLVQRVL